MVSFGWGLFAGALASLGLTTIAAFQVHRRLVALQQRARHAERLAELGTLTGGLAHEIKNPLSTVQLNLRLLEEDLLQDLPRDNPLYARVVNRLATVQRETSRLRDILDDFLRYAGKLELDRRPVDLNDLLEELADFFTPQAQAHRVQVRLKRSGGGPALATVDAKLVKQAVLNLMINAVQAMAEKGPAQGGELILSASAAGDGPGGEAAGRHARVDVIDTGPGIAPDALGQIFDAYYSTKATGTGLGLAMTRRIVEEHGGRIEVRSELDKGTDFTLLLPAGSPPGSPPGSPASQRGPGKGMTTFDHG